MLRTVADGYLYEVEEGKQSFTVAFLPDTIALYGTMGQQFFRNERNAKPDQLLVLFAEDKAIINSATLHKDGITNKEKFLDSVERLYVVHTLSAHQRNDLRAFIAKCDCDPPKIRHKLTHMGYGKILPDLDFADLEPELESTVEAMKIFLRKIKPVDLEKRRG